MAEHHDEHAITINSIEQLTSDVRRYRCTKPQGYVFEPGQATEVRVDKDGWRDEARPFTFTSLPTDDVLEFTIKSYPDHDGVTAQIGELSEGDRLVIGDSWGAITDNGAGTFIAGGAGVTPFIALLRQRGADGALTGCHLVCSNTTEADIIAREEFEAMPDLKVTWLVTGEPSSQFAAPRLDKAGLERVIGDFEGQFYVCGPDAMVSAIVEDLGELGAQTDSITLED